MLKQTIRLGAFLYSKGFPVAAIDLCKIEGVLWSVSEAIPVQYLNT